ncbi:RES family NAD+ phosphorylase [Fusobacterium hwasookii]
MKKKDKIEKICSNCFNDEFIKKKIKENGKKGDCSFCDSKNIEVIPVDDIEIKGFFESLIDIYTEEDEKADETSAELIKNILKVKWNIFSKNITPEKIEKFLRKLLPTKVNFFKKRLVLKLENEKDKICKKKNTWIDFVKEIKEKNRFHTGILELENLKYFLTSLEEEIKNSKLLYRGRISLNREKFSLKEMGAPPNPKNGRVNPEGIRCLYVAEEPETTIHEIRAIKHDYVCIGIFKLKRNHKVRIIDLTKIDKISPFLDLENIMKYAINYDFLKDIAEEISKPHKRSSTDLDYLPIQYIGEYIKYLGYDGIKYKSTLKPSGINYVFFDDSLWNCTEVDLYEIDEVSYRHVKL